jgi:hypothetical protein
MKQVLYEHWPLLMKMALDLIVVPLVASNFDLFVMWKFFGLFYSNVGNSIFLGEVCTTSQCIYL